MSTANLRVNDGPDCVNASIGDSTEEGGRRVEGKSELHVFTPLFYILLRSLLV